MSDSNTVEVKGLVDILDIIHANSVWSAESVQNEPETLLERWSVWKVDDDTIHFVGWAGYEGRVCSAVQQYDPTTRRGITKSGRVYELVGPSGHDSDAIYVWNRWLRIQGNPETVEITSEYESTSEPSLGS